VSLPATLPIGELVERLNALNPPALMGFPSKLLELARERQAGRLTIAPMLLTATSEMLAPEARAEIEAAFGVPVVDQFGSTEGLVGHSEPGDPTLVFASDLCIAELVDEDGRPVPDGTPSARVLITNVHNRTQPLIRYELTDRFTRVPGDGHLRARVEGRADEVFRYGDVHVHPIAFRTVMVKHPEVREYEVRQTADGAEIAIVADGELAPGPIQDEVAASLAAAGLPGARISVRATDALPRHPLTGKARRFIPCDTAAPAPRPTSSAGAS
jgi:phenylacetate-coenzyme A ligase PaaK-like adenylate-forming protein